MKALLDTIVKDLRRTPAERLPALAAIVKASSAPAAKGKKGSSASAALLAELVLDLPSRGSKLDEVERAVVLHAYQVANESVSAAARLLGIERKAFERRLAKYRR